jgi:hypothetical protein
LGYILGDFFINTSGHLEFITLTPGSLFYVSGFRNRAYPSLRHGQVPVRSPLLNRKQFFGPHPPHFRQTEELRSWGRGRRSNLRFSVPQIHFYVSRYFVLQCARLLISWQDHEGYYKTNYF